MQHKWTQDGGNFAYYQDLGLVRPWMFHSEKL
jgi:hypothetical protein